MIALMEFLDTKWFTDTLSKWFNIQIGGKNNIFENLGMMLLIGCTVVLAVVVLMVFSIFAMKSYKIYRIFRMAFGFIFYNAFIRYLL
jgi:hypothetical protein